MQEEHQHHCENYHLGAVPDNIVQFEEFYQARRERLRLRIADLLMRT